MLRVIETQHSRAHELAEHAEYRRLQAAGLVTYDEHDIPRLHPDAIKAMQDEARKAERNEKAGR